MCDLTQIHESNLIEQQRGEEKGRRGAECGVGEEMKFSVVIPQLASATGATLHSNTNT